MNVNSTARAATTMPSQPTVNAERPKPVSEVELSTADTYVAGEESFALEGMLMSGLGVCTGIGFGTVARALGCSPGLSHVVGLASGIAGSIGTAFAIREYYSG